MKQAAAASVSTVEVIQTVLTVNAVRRTFSVRHATIRVCSVTATLLVPYPFSVIATDSASVSLVLLDPSVTSVRKIILDSRRMDAGNTAIKSFLNMYYQFICVVH